MGMIDKLCGITFLLVSILSALFGSMVLSLVLPLLLPGKWLGKTNPIGLLCSKLHHRVADLVQAAWFIQCGWLLAVLFNISVRWQVEGPRGCFDASKAEDSPLRLVKEMLSSPNQPGKFKILMMNHRTRLDWMFLWITTGLLTSFSANASLKITLKKPMSRYPFFGWAMQHFRFLFLTRKWADDEKHINNVINTLKAEGESPVLLIFPEGSDLSPSNLEKSQRFAKENNQPQYRHVLNPRTTGLCAIVEMIGEENIESIIDITNGMSDARRAAGVLVRPSEKSMVDGTMPKVLHYAVRRYKFVKADNKYSGPDRYTFFSVPSPTGSSQLNPFRHWIEERFQAKEERLNKFYQGSPVGFLGVSDDSTMSVATYGTPAAITGEHDASWEGNVKKDFLNWNQVGNPGKNMTLVTVVIWTVSGWLCLPLFPLSLLWATYAVIMGLVGSTLGGWDNLLIF